MCIFCISHISRVSDIPKNGSGRALKWTRSRPLSIRRRSFFVRFQPVLAVLHSFPKCVIKCEFYIFFKTTKYMCISLKCRLCPFFLLSSCAPLSYLKLIFIPGGAEGGREGPGPARIDVHPERIDPEAALRSPRFCLRRFRFYCINRNTSIYFTFIVFYPEGSL